ncbi:MAG TPA: ROK family transcriptional regulator [Acidobacteriaceae bacterium]|jgi:glucokinase|nr:ROK family transcriptional regulator [Acidobacteriaceae bacterium]
MTKTRVPVGRPFLLRYTNALSILHLLREAGACSRADLVRASGLSAPTVTNVVAWLESAGLIAPLGEGTSNGGRPPDMIRFRAERGCAAAVEIAARSVSFMLADLNGEELARSEVALANRSTTPKAICSMIAAELSRMLRERKKSRAQLVSLVVGVPAITDVEKGLVLAVSPLDNWRNVPLRSMLSKIFACPVLIENDTNLAAQGERYCGSAQGEDNFVYIAIGVGVGAGIMVGGRLHHGSQWSAGEIGYLRLPNVSAGHPTLHRFGELEKVLSIKGIEKSWKLDPSESRVERRQLKAAAILDLAAGRDTRAHHIVEDRAQLLSDVIVNISLILNPALVLLGGDVGSHPVLLKSVRAKLADSEFAVPHIRSGVLGKAAVLWGGIEVGLRISLPALLPQDSPAS